MNTAHAISTEFPFGVRYWDSRGKSWVSEMDGSYTTYRTKQAAYRAAGRISKLYTCCRVVKAPHIKS